MAQKDSLGDRMKNSYENRTRSYLPRRTYTVIRLDGKAFHTFTRGFNKPFDDDLVETMQQTMFYLCENISGVALGYCQSDEITLVLTDFKSNQTEAWFDGNLQKMVSISASMATAFFNRYWKRNDNLAMFDSRVFTIPDPTEVINCLIWRQKDAQRNSIQMIGQANFSHKQLQNKSNLDIVDMLRIIGHGPEDYPIGHLQGYWCIKVQNPNYGSRTYWEIHGAPEFTKNWDLVKSKIPVYDSSDEQALNRAR